MTRNEFFKRLNNLIAAHPIIAKSKRKTLNELLYVLRMDKEHDYCINVDDPAAENRWLCIPSVKECFVPVRDLKKHVRSVDFDEMGEGSEAVCIVVVVEK